MARSGVGGYLRKLVELGLIALLLWGLVQLVGIFPERRGAAPRDAFMGECLQRHDLVECERRYGERESPMPGRRAPRLIEEGR